MGMGPGWSNYVNLEPAWDWTTSKLSIGWSWVQAFAEAHLSYAPLMTTTVAIGAGFIALYAVHEQRKIARRRAAIDFFLKTEMDDALLQRYADFERKVVGLNASMTQTTTMAELSAMPDYPAIRGYLNIHELIAVGIRLKVFDRKVCYYYWSAVLVEQCHAAERIIEVARKEPEDRAAYIEVLRLKKKWERKLWLWRWWAGLPTNRPANAVIPPPTTPLAVPPIAAVQPEPGPPDDPEAQDHVAPPG